MGKKVVAINSSRKKGNTYNQILKIQDMLHKSNINVEIINLFDYRVKECLGCELCLRKGSCHLDDDANLLMNKLTQYDGIILSSPVYMGHISGKLKIFIDRTCKWFHRPELVGVPMLFVTTTAASGLRDTLGYLETVSIQWGGQPVGKIGRRVNTLDTVIKEKEVNNFISHIFKNKEKYRPKLKQLIHFQVQRVLAEKILDIDKEYWERNDWLGKNYFYDAQISIVNKATSNLFYKFLSKKVKKVGK